MWWIQTQKYKIFWHQITPAFASDIILYIKPPVGLSWILNLVVKAVWHHWLIPSHVFIQQHATEDSERLHRVGKFAHHQVDADCVPSLQRQDDVEDSQRSWNCFGLSHRVVLQAFRLVTSRVNPGHTIVWLGQNCLDLLILMTSQNSTEEVMSIYRGGENTWRGQIQAKIKIRKPLLTHCETAIKWLRVIVSLF